MIYICKGCSEVCKAPCKACDFVCTGCSKACNGACKGCSKACDSVGKACNDLWSPIINGPLGCFVISTWVCMLLAGLCGAAGASSAKCSDAQMVCGAAVGMAVLHACFVFYLQRRIISGLKAKGVSPSSNKDLASEAGQIILYDVGFCLYIFAFFGCFGFCFYGLMLLSCGGGLGYAAVGLLIFFHMTAPGYGMCWYCGQCCFGKVSSARSGSGPAPQTVGPPSAADKA